MGQLTAGIRAIEYALPGTELTNEMLANEYPEWSVSKIYEKTGIATRRIAADGQCASDLAALACEKLFASGVAKPAEIDFLVLCTQSPDYFLPATACLLQEKLGLPRHCGAFDFNQGCSGFVYGLGLAKGLIESGQARNVLLVTAETYSKFINKGDKSVRTLFGDGAAATLVSATEGPRALMDSFVYGTDGSGAKNLIVPAGGTRRPVDADAMREEVDGSGNVRSAMNLYMNGSAVFEFSMKEVPKVVEAVLSKSRLTVEDVDVFAFHQASRFMLDALRRKLRIPTEKFLQAFELCGNTVSSTIPIVLHEAQRAGTLKAGARVVAVGFGVGYSWGGCLIRWQ